MIAICDEYRDTFIKKISSVGFGSRNSNYILAFVDDDFNSKSTPKIAPISILNSTDYVVLRHQREITLNIELTLSSDEFIEFESYRDTIAKTISKS